MKTKPVLTLADAQRMVDAAKQYAEAHQLAVTIAVADDSGSLLALARLDGASPLSAHIGPAKAHTAALGRRETKGMEDMINQGRTAFLSVPLVHGMLEGGVPVIVDGEVAGSIGVSGVKPNEDAAIARAGIAALGL